MKTSHKQIEISTELKKEGKVTRNFNYSKGEVTLNFNLRIDTKTELKDFLECLLEGIKDVQEEINKN